MFPNITTVYLHITEVFLNGMLSATPVELYYICIAGILQLSVLIQLWARLMFMSYSGFFQNFPGMRHDAFGAYELWN